MIAPVSDTWRDLQGPKLFPVGPPFPLQLLIPDIAITDDRVKTITHILVDQLQEYSGKH